MARNRVIYQSEALYVSEEAASTASGNHKQLERVQSANYSFSIARQDINQYGTLSRIDTMILEAPTVNMDISYYLTDGYNEKQLGFATNGTKGFLSGHMINSAGKNLYIVTSKEGFDANGSATANDPFPSIGLGNAYLTNYGLEVAVGAIPTVSVSFEASNICSTSDSSINGAGTAITGVTQPAVNQEDGSILTTTKATLPVPITGVSTATALRPGDVTLTFGGFTAAGTGLAAPMNQFSGVTGMHIQSASLSVPLNRTPLQRLGSKFAYARAVDFPIKATLSVKAIVNEITARNLAAMINDSVEKDITLTLKDEANAAKSIFTLKACTLDSESISSSIGSNKSVDLTFSTQVGGIDDSTKGIFYSGTTP